MGAWTARIDSSRIVPYGRSLGGSPAAILAAERSAPALILESAFTSARAFARQFRAPGFLSAIRSTRWRVRRFPGPSWCCTATTTRSCPSTTAGRWRPRHRARPCGAPVRPQRLPAALVRGPPISRRSPCRAAARWSRSWTMPRPAQIDLWPRSTPNASSSARREWLQQGARPSGS